MKNHEGESKIVKWERYRIKKPRRSFVIWWLHVPRGGYKEREVLTAERAASPGKECCQREEARAEGEKSYLSGEKGIGEQKRRLRLSGEYRKSPLFTQIKQSTVQMKLMI
jgi:hypothetical protein